MFAGTRGTLNAQDIDHALGDSGAIVQDQITIAILSGNVKQFEQLYSRAKQDGLPPIALLRQTLSLFRGMLSARLAMNAVSWLARPYQGSDRRCISKPNPWLQHN